MSKRIDLTGKTINKIYFKSFSHIDDVGNSVWNCICHCKKPFKSIAAKIKNGKKISCGCAHKKYHLNEDYFKKIDNSRKAFWFGFICADGGLRKVGNRFIFKIDQKEKMLLTEFLKDIESEHPLKETIPSKNRYGQENFYELVIVNKEFGEKLFNVGKTLLKKDLKFIPKSVPQKFIIDFIRGYFEGDGSIYYVSFSKIWNIGISGNYELLNDFHKYIVKNIIKRESGTIAKNKSIFKLSYSKNDTEKIMKAMYYDKYCIGEKIWKYENGI